MKLNESFTYDGKSVEDVYANVSSEAFRSESCVKQRSAEYSVTVEENAIGGHLVTIVRATPADMPDFIKKFTGDTVKVKQTENWSGPAADGSRKADIKVRIIGQPAEFNGTSTLVTSGSDTNLVLAGDVKVSVPFIGKKIEPEIGKAILASLRYEVALAMEK
ncbi:MAG: DUF2505 domain-containing protein [Aeromicrobium sp.]